ncbi:hypothetical protein B566_EDAN007542, partial [Ephemera danica]
MNTKMSSENTESEVQYLPLPIKSDFDEKDYSNAEERIDAATLMSAASVTIMTGTFDDPEGFAGMSHFLEHMTFKGSQKYPGESGLFMSERGGYINAETDRDSTTYFFSIQPKYFSTSLDIVAQSIAAPLLPKEMIKSEVQAIES